MVYIFGIFPVWALMCSVFYYLYVLDWVIKPEFGEKPIGYFSFMSMLIVLGLAGGFILAPDVFIVPILAYYFLVWIGSRLAEIMRDLPELQKIPNILVMGMIVIGFFLGLADIDIFQFASEWLGMVSIIIGSVLTFAKSLVSIN